MSPRDRGVLWASGAALVASLAVVGALDGPRHHVPVFLGLYAIAFAAYALAVRTVWRTGGGGRGAQWTIAVVAVAARVVMLPAPPDLSPDVYRYAWEGRMVLHGVNPFVAAPADTSLSAFRGADYARITQKTLATIYPPLAQGAFALAARIHPGVRTLKGIFTLFDLATIAVVIILLRARGRPGTHAIVYAWSPLVMVETAHSGHVDVLGAFLLVCGLVLWERGQRVWAAVLLGASALAKYLAAVLVPYLARRRALSALAVMAAVVCAGYLPFAGAGTRLFGSLRAYGENWWFNGPPFLSLSALLGSEPWARGVLAACGMAFAIVTAVRERDMARYLYRVVACALLVTPTVYPWYVIWIVPLLCVYPSRAWIAFTGLVMISYWVWVEYDRTALWHLPTWALALEYAPFYGLLVQGWTRARRV